MSNIASMNMLLNPGPDYELEAQDTCFYISLVKEENYDWKISRTKICKFIWHFFVLFKLKLKTFFLMIWFDILTLNGFLYNKICFAHTFKAVYVLKLLC
jgi:hypothetical protein